MNLHQLMRDLREDNGSKIVLVVADGLGGLPMEPGRKTELETARTPNLDAMVREGVCGLSVPVLPGITPGSGPGHLGLFGYDPLEYQIGRGILEALGINFQVGPRDVAIRGNFCTVNDKGLITDRRAGRPTTERCIEMCKKLAACGVAGSVSATPQAAKGEVEVFVEPVREHRFVLVLRGDNLGDNVNDTDPQALNVAPLHAVGEDAASQNTAKAINAFLLDAAKTLKNDAPTNMVTLRGIARYPKIATMQDIYGLRSACIAVYPMYKGLARLVGMDILDAGTTLAEQVDALKKAWDKYDFFFLHYKCTDSTGEDGDFDAKVAKIEAFDLEIPRIRALHPDVVIVTGDHSTPSKMKSHSWHPVPTVLCAKTVRPDGAVEFGESFCLRGGLGQFEAKYLMSLAMAHAGRLAKYGA
ncbi:MAG: 2,3-bisphosphoglycerate-independent phosphoglycerate mutase [Planctomycetes bacterium]|nr:2,3-bisphosphoglycerate-independent phosphoglycerate mutase [Planctomycetota bacterium]